LFQGEARLLRDGAQLRDGVGCLSPYRTARIILQRLDDRGHDLGKDFQVVVAQFLDGFGPPALVRLFLEDLEELRHALGGVGLGRPPQKAGVARGRQDSDEKRDEQRTAPHTRKAREARFPPTPGSAEGSWKNLPDGSSPRRPSPFRNRLFFRHLPRSTPAQPIRSILSASSLLLSGSPASAQFIAPRKHTGPAHTEGGPPAVRRPMDCKRWPLINRARPRRRPPGRLRLARHACSAARGLQASWDRGASSSAPDRWAGR